MYILNNSIKNLLRNKVRNIFNMIITLLMISSIAIFVIINSSTNGILSEYKKKFESEVQIKINQEKLIEDISNGKSIKDNIPTTSEYLDFAKSKYVKKAYFTGTMNVYFEGLKEEKYKDVHNKDYHNKQYTICRVIGYTSDNKEFNLPNINITEGNIFKNNNECIVSKQFLDTNNLKVGAKIKVASQYENEKEKILTLKIVGTYINKKNTNKISDNQAVEIDMPIYEDILTTYKTLVTFENNLNINEPIMSTHAQFLLKDYKYKKDFEKELRNKGLSNINKITIDEDTYRKVVTPIEHLSNKSYIYMFGVLILGSLLLITNYTFSVKKIRYEVGVLRAIGISKLKIIRGLLYESIIITIVCLILGIGIANIAAQPVSDYIFKQQKEYNQVYESYLYDNNDVAYNSINKENIKKEMKILKVELKSNSVLKMLAVALLLILLNSLVSIYNTIVYKPIHIIHDRS